MILVTDLLRTPIDEGAKVAVFNLLQQIKSFNTAAYIYSINGTEEFSFIDTSLYLNKFLLDKSFYKSIRKLNYERMLYIPEASVTLFSFIRAKLLSVFTGKDVYVLALQHRRYHFITRIIIKSIPPECVITQSRNTAQYLSDLGIMNRILPLGVDDEKYREYNLTKKTAIRNSFKIKSDKIVLLHVGHIQQSRNLKWLKYVKENCPEVEIIIVGSTYNQDEEKLHSKLQDSGIRLICEFIPDMTTIYNLADYYVFPVLQNDGAIETPLSVLEAMACNLPIITSCFGSLPDFFEEDSDFHYVNSAHEIVEIIGKLGSFGCKNREKIKPFIWKEIARKLVEIVGH